MRVVLFLLPLFFSAAEALEVKGKVQVSLVQGDELSSWLDKDTGVVRFDNNGLELQQGIVQLSQDIFSDLDIVADASYYADGDQHLGLTQLQLRYKPVVEGSVKWRARAGFFYPKLSLENVDVGWLSPYSYNQSAINSWIGEELRTAGLEFTLYSPGRSRRSPWSWELHAAAFKGNDPTGTLLTWRGFAIHDRQSLHHERVEFARIPTVLDRNLLWHPSWVEPFKEIDGRWGVYLGAHLEYMRSSKLRYYYYDNRANPKAVNEQRLYAWHTRFHSLALQHNFTPQTRVISQWMTGSTEMGYRFVYADFDAFYLLLSHRMDKHRVSVRYDYFNVDEDDQYPQDQNNSDGQGLTVSWRYNFNDEWQVGVEHLVTTNEAANRVQLGQATKVTQHQSLLVLQYSF